MPGNKYLMAASTGPMTFTKTTADESYVREARMTGPIEQVSDADNLVGHRFYHVRVRAFVPFPLPPLKGDSGRTSRCDPRKAVVIVDFTHKGVVHRVWPCGLDIPDHPGEVFLNASWVARSVLGWIGRGFR